MRNAIELATSVVCRKKSSIIKYAIPIIVVTFLFAGLCPAQTQFSRAVGGTGYEEPRSVVQTNDGGYAVAGYTSSFGAGRNDLFLVKLSSIGSLDWAKAVGGTDSDHGYSVVQTNDGGYAVAGYTSSFGAGGSDLFLVKFDSTGSVEWAKAVGGISGDVGNSVIQTTDNGYVVMGVTRSFGAVPPTYDLFLVKFNSTGSLEWAKAVVGLHIPSGRSVVQTSDGGYALTGVITLVKLSSTGSLEWAKAVVGLHIPSGRSVVQTSDGGYALTGVITLVKLSSTGSLDWAKAVGGISGDVGNSVIQTTDGGYAVAGYTSSFGAGRSDLFLVKFDSDGNTCIGSEAFPTVMDVIPSVDSVSPTVTIPPLSISDVTPTITIVDPTVTVICTDLISETLSKPISFELTVSPNPFNSSCAITISTISATVEIFDLQGRLVWNKPSDSDYIGATSLIKRGKPEAVPLNKGDVAKRQGVSASSQGIIIWNPSESISSGVYLVRATTDDGQQIAKRIVYLK